MKNDRNYTDVFSWIAMAGLLFWFAYTRGWIFANFPSVDANTAMHLIETDKNVTILDVRTIGEYRAGHLSNAILIPLNELETDIHKLQKSKNKKILVYCQTGNRSISASRILEQHGFHPINVKGGILALKSAGAEIIRQ
ncbi:MAG: rhodanese-like domain-containing protein [Sulfurimonas sp.]